MSDPGPSAFRPLERPRRRRPWVAPAAIVSVIVLVVVAAVLVSVVHGRQTTRGVRAGQVWSTSTLLGERPDVDFDLPVGTLQVAVGDPVTSLPGYDVPDDVASSGADVHSGRGLRFVPVRWSLTGAEVPLDAPTYGFRLVLVSDGRRYDLGSDRAPAESVSYDDSERTVVVSGHADHLGLEVTYDGLTQTADLDGDTVDAGAAAGLAGTTRFAFRRGCSLLSVREQEMFQDAQVFSCDVGEPTTTTYVPGLGWATSDRPWLVLDVHLMFNDYVYDGHRITDLSHEPFRLDLDGRRPQAVLSPYDDDNAYYATVVFRPSSTPHVLTVHARFHSTGRGRGLSFGPRPLPLTRVR